MAHPVFARSDPVGSQALSSYQIPRRQSLFIFSFIFICFWFLLQMSEHFNQEISLPGKIPSGLFNAMFEYSGCWQKDASSTKTLAFDGWFITLYAIALTKSQIVLRDHVKQAVPSSWDPAALAR